MRTNLAWESLWQDLRFGARLLRKSPAFSLAAILSLGLGIGLTTSIFAVLDALLLRPLPVAEPSRLVDLYTSGADGDTFSTSSLPDLLDFRTQTPAVADIVGYTPMFSAVSRGGPGDRARMMMGEAVTGNYFRMLGVSARIGRTLLPEDDVAGAPRVVVVSERYWRRELGADASVLGRSLRLRGEPFTIVGVIERSFAGMLPLLAPEMWVATAYVENVEPAGINEVVPSPTGTSRLDRRGSRWLFAKARLAPGMSVEQARANVQVVAARLAAAYPQTNKDRRVTVRATTATRIHPEADSAVMLMASATMAAVSLVLLIACANVAGMLLARGSARAREVSVRLALGAGRRRLVQQLLIETALLASAGAAVGLALTWWVMQALSTIDLPLPIPVPIDLRIDVRILAFTIAAAMATALLAGLMPALKATRLDLVSALRGDSSVGRAAGRRWTLRDLLVVGQMAVTTVLLVVAGLLVKSLSVSQQANVGFDPNGLAVVSTDTDMLRYSRERMAQFYEEAEARVRALPGVVSVARGTRVPFSLNYNQNNIAVPGHQTADDQTGRAIQASSVTPTFFETLGIPIVQGRMVSEQDTPKTPPVAIINQTMARRYWPNGSAIGQRVFQRTLASGISYEIVGIVADHKMRTVGEVSQPAIFFAMKQDPNSYQTIIARTRGDEHTLVTAMRQAMLGIDANLLFMEQETMREHAAGMMLPVRVGALLVMVFSSLGLLLAAVGLYGVIAFSVARRTREIGIRVAIGARPRQVLRAIMTQGLTLAAAGLIVGGVLAGLAARAVAGALYGVSAIDPLVWGVAATTLLGVAALANALPAYRAMRIDPARALRVE